MTTLALRTIGLPERLFLVARGSFRLANYQTASGSLLSRQVRVSGLMEQRWACELENGIMTRAEVHEWNSFIARLAGQAVLFTVRAPGQELPIGAAAGFAPGNPAYAIAGTTITGTSIVTGAVTCLVARPAARYARTIYVAGLKPGVLALTHGDVLGIAGNLYEVTGRVYADEDGEARVPFRWRLWRGAKAGDVVTLRKATCRMMLRTADAGTVQLQAAMHGQAGISAVEVPYT